MSSKRKKSSSSSGRMRSYKANGLRASKMSTRNMPVAVQSCSIVITIAQNFLSPIVTYRSIAHRFFMLVSERICTYQFVNKSFTMIVLIVSDRNGIANSIVTIYRNVVVIATLEPRSYHQKLTNRDIIASPTEQSHQNASARIITFQT